MADKINRFRQVRLDMKLKVYEMAERLGVAPSTISNWENGRFPVPDSKLALVAEISGCSLTYLLGEDTEQVSWTAPVQPGHFPALHRCPVWSAECGWGLVNAVAGTMVLADGTVVPLGDVAVKLYGIPPAFSVSLSGFGEPFGRQELIRAGTVWVEPISTDEGLREELRGWYHVKSGRYVDNEFGNRFYFDTYLAKWAAYAEAPIE